MVRMVQAALDLAGVDGPVKIVVIGPDGEIVDREPDLSGCCQGVGRPQA
ncbi:MAG: hypothetical protein GX536_09390 [Actinobacteria bacterium]|nr:hypothetical protein [Actinomycetota bacterium]